MGLYNIGDFKVIISDALRPNEIVWDKDLVYVGRSGFESLVFDANLTTSDREFLQDLKVAV